MKPTNVAKMAPAAFFDRQLLLIIGFIFIAGIVMYISISVFQENLGTVSFGGGS